MVCYGYADEQTCQFLTDEDDFCPCHRRMYEMSKALAPNNKHEFFNEPKMHKLEYRHKLRYMTDYRYMSQMYEMEKKIEKTLGRFRHFFRVVCIQRCFKRAVSSPEYLMCRRRIASEWESLKGTFEVR